MPKFITYTDRVLHVHHPRVVVETAVEHGAERAALFENSELTAEMLTSPHMRVSYAQYGILSYNALRLTGNPALGLHVGRNTGIGQMGAIGFLLQNSPTIGAALAALIEYEASVVPGWDFTLDVEGDQATLTLAETIPMNPLREFAHEVTLATIDNQTRALQGGKSIPVRRIEIPFSEPAHASEYRALFYDVPIHFDRPVAKVVFDRALLDVRVPFANPATLQLAREFCARLMPQEASQGLVSQVKRLLSTELGPPPSPGEIARKLQTSTRTLRRELSSMRTSYKELVDESRRLRAEAWMKTSSLPVKQLAEVLGFSSTASLRRAYKRWTGTVPGSRRKR